MMREILIFLFALFLQTNIFCQEGDIKKGKDILDKYDIKNNSNIELNKNGYHLELKKRQAKKIAKVILYDVYGRFNILKQKPFFSCQVNDFWIFQGKIKKNRKGGVFVIIINSKNGSVEYLSHGK